MDKRHTMLTAYEQNSDMLALDLEILFEPCTDPQFAVLHNAAIEKITRLCGKLVEEKDEAGIAKISEFKLECKFNLAKHLARNVLMYARQQ